MDLSFTKIKETCLYVSDLDRTQAFYQYTLGLPLISKKDGRHIFFRAGSSVLLCFLPEITQTDTHLPPHYGHGKLHFAFECKQSDYNRWKEKLTQLQIPIIQEVEWAPGLFSCYFHDPDGHVLEIVMPKMWEN